jgi:hypothetical protein
MCRLQVSLVPIKPYQPLLPLPPYIDPFIMADTMSMPRCGDFYGSPFCAGPPYKGMGHWRHQHYQHQAPAPGPSRNQRRGLRKAGLLTNTNDLHRVSGSYRTIVEDRFIGIDQGHVSINASNNPQGGKVWRTPL